MRKNWGFSSGGPARPFGDRRWLVPFLASLLVTVTLFLAAACGLFSPPYPGRGGAGGGDALLFDVVSLDNWDDASPGDGARSVESGIKNRQLESNSDEDDDDNPDNAAVNSDDSDAEPPRIAYLLEGTKGDGLRMRRTLQAIYHPRNQYILHLDLEAPPRERIDLAMYVKGDPMFSQVGNVRVIAKGNLVTYKGPTMVACTLHAVAILLKEGLEWDWFINLSASDYPLMTQDDILHVFSSLPRNLNFIEHFQLSGWKVISRAKPIVLDPGLYLSKKFDLTMTTERRELPTAFKLYTGSAWIMLTKSFLEYCIWGWDNLPRNLLMYYVNFISSPEGYFQTVICNSDDFRGTAVSHDLHYIAWDYPPKQHPLILSMKDFNRMVKSGAPFARKFPKDDKVLDKIDRELLHRSEGRFTPGAWCDGSSEGGADPCLSRGEDSVFEPGPGAERLRGLMKKVLSWDYRNGSCSSLAYDQTKRDWYVPKIFELLGQSVGDPDHEEEDIPIVLRSWQAQNFLVTAMHVKGPSSNMNVLGVTEVQELLLSGGSQTPRSVHEVIAHLVSRLSRWDDRLFRKYVFGEADEIELKFVNRRNSEDLNLVSIILNQEIRRLATQVIRVKWSLHAREEIVLELLRHLRGNATRAILESIRKFTRDMLEEQEAVRGRLFTIQDVMQSTVRAWLQDRSLRVTHNLAIFGGGGMVLSIITGLFGINVDGIPGAQNTPYAFGLFAGLLFFLGIVLVGMGMLYLGLQNPVSSEKVKVRKLELQQLVSMFQHEAEQHGKVREGLSRHGLSPSSSAALDEGYILIS